MLGHSTGLHDALPICRPVECGDGQHLAGRTSIGQEIDGGYGRAIYHWASDSRREKLRAGVVTDWYDPIGKE